MNNGQTIACSMPVERLNVREGTPYMVVGNSKTLFLFLLQPIPNLKNSSRHDLLIKFLFKSQSPSDFWQQSHLSNFVSSSSDCQSSFFLVWSSKWFPAIFNNLLHRQVDFPSYNFDFQLILACELIFHQISIFSSFFGCNLSHNLQLSTMISSSNYNMCFLASSDSDFSFHAFSSFFQPYSQCSSRNSVLSTGHLQLALGYLARIFVI